MSATVTGVLDGITVLELGGIGPIPFCGMMLADHGATVIQLRRPQPAGTRATPDLSRSPLYRSRTVLEIDLKDPRGIDVVRRLIARSDALIEGFRPGVLERMGLEPQALIDTLNPRLVVGRMTGWGQDGPLATTAGHDINFLALSGTLGMLGEADRPPRPPMNLLGDFGGGGLLLAFAVVAALLRARISGRGQVVDCAIVDGAALLSAMMWGFRAQGRWEWQRNTNFLDGGAHYYDTYRCADGRYLAVGALEPEFYAEFVARLGLDPALLGEGRASAEGWARMRPLVRDALARRTRDEWCRVFEGSDACVSPVLEPEEAPRHPHLVARGTFVTTPAGVQPAPAPRFSADPPRRAEAAGGGASIDALLADAGVAAAELESLRRAGVIAPAPEPRASQGGKR